MIDRLRALGMPPDATLDRLIRGEIAFPDLAEFNLEGPEHGIPNLDPGFVPIASVGNGDYYGLYVYPPLGSVPVVEFLHDVPSVEWVAPSLADWLAGNVAMPPEWHNVLPTEARVEKRGDALRWLVERCPGDGLAWERELATFWVGNDGLWEHALIDFGCEAYRKLNWPLHLAVMEAAAEWGPTDLRPEARHARKLEMWATLHPPLGEDARFIVARLGEPDADAIYGEWISRLGWEQAHQHADRRASRASLGNALVDAFLKANSPALADRIRHFEFEEGLERVAGPLAEELRRLRQAHEQQKKTIAHDNDWSDV